MDTDWRSTNYYESRESQENSNQEQNYLKSSKIIKIIFLLIIFILLFFKQPGNKTNYNQENKNNSRDLVKKGNEKQEIIPENQLIKAKEYFEQYNYIDSIGPTKNIIYNIYKPPFISEKEKIPLIIYLNDERAIGKESSQFLESMGGLIWATDMMQTKHKSFVLIPCYNEILIDNLNDNIKSNYLDITIRLISFLKTKYQNIDENKIYLTGQSMGGTATLYLLSNYPYIFSAGLIVGGKNLNLNELKSLFNCSFVLISLIEDEISYNCQKGLMDYLYREKKINYGAVSSINLKDDSELNNMYIQNMFNLGYRHNFINFQKTEGYNNYINTYNYGYEFTAVREWLFKQQIKIYDKYYKTKNGRLVLTKNCIEADNNNICTKCSDGYFLSKDRNGCTSEKNCEKGGADFCAECISGFFLDLKTKKCISYNEKNEFNFCKEVNENICTQCQKYYFLDMEHKCTITDNCEKSEDSKCIRCYKGYFLGKDNKCTNIENCIYSNHGECTECIEGFYYDKISHECKFWNNNKNLKNCKSTYLDDSTKCSACKDNYYLNRKEKLCKSNLKKGKFYKCQISNDRGDACSFCVKDYFLGRNDQKCSLIYGCLASKDENNCIECDTDFCLDNNNNCINNYEIIEISQKYFYRCSKLNPNGNGCEKCENDDLEINRLGLCYDSKHCEKYEKGSCIKCKKENLEGYNSYCLNKEFGCVSSFKKNCVRCDDILNLDECTQCEEGYELDKEGNCV